MKKTKVAVIVLNWNGKKDTLECIETVLASKTKTIEILPVIVDNASQDNSVVLFSKKFPNVKIIENKQNFGFAGGNNVGIAWALQQGCQGVILLNNDTSVDVDTFETLFSLAKRYGYDLASPKIYFYPGNEFHKDTYLKKERGKVLWYAGGRVDWKNVIAQHIGVDEVDQGQWDRSTETDFATGCCLYIGKKVIQAIGVLDSEYIAYYEDNDYCQKAKRAGFKVGYVHESYLWHKNAGSSGGSGSSKQNILVRKSRLRFAMRYAPWRAKLAVIREYIRQTAANAKKK